MGIHCYPDPAFYVDKTDECKWYACSMVFTFPSKCHIRKISYLVSCLLARMNSERKDLICDIFLTKCLFSFFTGIFHRKWDWWNNVIVLFGRLCYMPRSWFLLSSCLAYWMLVYAKTKTNRQIIFNLKSPSKNFLKNNLSTSIYSINLFELGMHCWGCLRLTYVYTSSGNMLA